MPKCRLLGCLHFGGGGNDIKHGCRVMCFSAMPSTNPQSCKDSSPRIFPPLLFCTVPLVHSFSVARFLRAKPFFASWSWCFAAGARAVFLRVGILAFSSSLQNFFCSTVSGKANLCSSLPRSLLPPRGSRTCFQQTVRQRHVFRLFVYNADEARLVKRNNSFYWNN